MGVGYDQYSIHKCETFIEYIFVFFFLQPPADPLLICVAVTAVLLGRFFFFNLAQCGALGERVIVRELWRSRQDSAHVGFMSLRSAIPDPDVLTGGNGRPACVSSTILYIKHRQ